LARRDNRVGDAGAVHGGLKIIGGDLGGRDDLAFFVFKLLLLATVEKEGDVRILFRFGNVVLVHAVLAQPFGKHVVEILRRENNREGEIVLVLCHRRDVQARAHNVRLKLQLEASSQGGGRKQESPFKKFAWQTCGAMPRHVAISRMRSERKLNRSTVSSSVERGEH
jgi:hypothetical protein